MHRMSWRSVALAVSALAIPARAWADVAPGPGDLVSAAADDPSSGLVWAIGGIAVLAALGIWFYRRNR